MQALLYVPGGAGTLTRDRLLIKTDHRQLTTEDQRPQYQCHSQYFSWARFARCQTIPGCVAGYWGPIERPLTMPIGDVCAPKGVAGAKPMRGESEGCPLSNSLSVSPRSGEA